MPYPSHFYVKEKQEQVIYSRKQQGILDVNRLIKGKPPWRVIKFTGEPQPKSLILADWTAGRWSEGQSPSLSERIKAISDLLDQGFPFFLWQNGVLVKVTKGNLSRLYQKGMREEITPESSEKILLAAEQRNQLDPKKIKVLNEDWFDLLKTDKTMPRKLFISDLAETNHNTDTLLYILKMATPPVTQIVQNEFSEKANALNLKAVSFFPKAEVIQQVSKLKLNRQQLEKLLQEGKFTLEDGTSFSLNQLSSITSLELEGKSIRINDLQTLLTKAENLKYLRLPAELEGTFAESINLIKLKSLDLSSSDITTEHFITTEHLEFLLRQTKNLESLNLHKCTNIKDELSQQLNLTSLKSLDLSHTELTLSNLKILLTQTKNLEKLNLSYIRYYNWNGFEPVNLANLKWLDCSNSTILTIGLNSILTQAKNLEELDLSHCFNNDWDGLEPLNLANLKSLDCSNTWITAKALNSILTQAKNLEELKLSGCGDCKWGSLNLVNLVKLKSLDVAGSKITVDELKLILQQVKNIEKLDLKNCINIVWNELKSANLLSIKSLNLDSNSLTIESLGSLLSQTKNLESLGLWSCKNLTSDFTAQCNLTSLKALNANCSDISTEFLQSFLTQAKYLETLNLSECVNLNNDFTRPLNLEYLKTLSLQFCKIPTKNLQYLLTQAKNLKELDLTGSDTSEWSELNQWNLASLESLNLCYSPITANQLKALLQATPMLKYLDLTGCELLDSNDEELTQIIKGLNLKYLRNPDHYQNTAKGISESLGINRDGVEATMDCDTSNDPDKKLNVSRLFFPLKEGDTSPNPTEYRLDVYDKLAVNTAPCSPKEAFKLNKTGELKLTYHHKSFLNSTEKLLEMGRELAQLNTKKSLLYGKQELELNTSWRPIASQGLFEKMTHYNIDPQNTKVEIAYSESENRYYIRSDQPQKVSFEFLIEVTAPKKNLALPKDIQKMVTEISKYGEGELNLRGMNKPTGADYLKALREQKKGACRHRAVAFKAYMQETHPDIPVRVIINQCHAFAEVQIKGQWLTCNLGGYPAKLVINESANPDPNANKTAVTEQQIDQPGPKVSRALPLNVYEQQLATWITNKPTAGSVAEYCQQGMKWGEKKSRLVEFTSSTDVHAMQLSMQAYCKGTERPCFYINSPEDLVCSAAFVERDKNTNQGVLKKGPGGPLYDFLIKYKDHAPPPVLIVNYDQFDADDMVRFNGLLDKKPNADGTALGDKTLVVGLLNVDKPDCYQGADFYSRFGTVESNPFTAEMLTEHMQKIAPLTVHKEKAEEACTSINLFNSLDWKERLLGRWEIKGDSLNFVEGALQQALDKGLPIEIQNGLWETESFQLFWQQAYLLGYIEYEGRRITIPGELKLFRTEGYNWEELKQQASFDTALQNQAQTLNPARLSDFFTGYEYKDGKLNTIPGIIEQHAKQTLDINLTRALSDDVWAMLLSACKEPHRVNLSIHCAPGVEVPSFLVQEFKPVPRVWDTKVDLKTQVLVTTDIDASIQQLTQGGESYQIIEISECSSDDLLIHTESNMIEGRLEFKQSERALLTALKQNKKIILKGDFSEELIDSLAPILLARQAESEPSGQLILLSTEDCFNYLPANQHQVSPQEKKPKNLQGLMGISGGVKLDEFDPLNSAQIAKNFNDKRKQEVEAILAEQPYVFLTGLTGVGKSTFVEKNLKTEDSNLYLDESNILNWALDKSAKRKILFIDEANISSRQWSEFEGLFNKPPGIMIDGQFYELSDSHKVVFAGNPVNYGDRKLAPFFARHGNALVFDPMPPEFIYEELLKPIFVGTALEKQSADICLPLLNIYRFLCECSEDKVLISPRELEMMALLIASYAKYHPHLRQKDFLLAAQHYAYQLGGHLVPEQFRERLDNEFKPAKDLPTKPAKPAAELNEFLVTNSRKTIIRQLDDMLELRQLRCQTTNERQRYGGLGGIVLEGEPGCGKSELVIASLRAQGYEEVHDYQGTSKKPLPEKPFYRMPVSMQPEDKKALLLKAFNEGAVVVIDEINSSPMMERLLNDLLMGKTPDKKRPLKPGFLIIGTQNPATMAGRRTTSTALARRLITMTVPSYTSQEMIEILTKKGIRSTRAQLMVEAFEKNVRKAKNENLTPAPTFRDLIKLADSVIKGQSKEMLFENIASLQTHSYKLAVRGDKEGQKVNKLAKQLLTVANSYFEVQVNKPEGLKAIRSEFKTILKAGYKESGRQWKPILANIAIAATGIGLLAMTVKYFVTGNARFVQTKQQKLVKAIEKGLDEIETRRKASSV